jgi:uncharacterized Zn-finger protein
MHTPANQHNCPICGKGFYLQQALLQHM